MRRYCLPCSAKTGRLVQRSAPALEKQRAQRSAALAAKRQAKVQKAREKEVAYFTVAGVDLRKEMKRICRLPSMGGAKGRMARRPPALVIPRMSQRPRSRLGFADPSKREIRILDYPGITPEDVKEILVHELVHIDLGYRLNHDRNHHEWHGRAFHDKMREAFWEAYKVTPKGAQENSYHGRYARALREKEAA